MYSSLVLAPLLVALANAKPVDKRALITSTYTTTYWTTVTVTGEPPAMSEMPYSDEEGYGYGSDEEGYGYPPYSSSMAPVDSVVSTSTVIDLGMGGSMTMPMDTMTVAETTEASSSTVSMESEAESTTMEEETYETDAAEPPAAEFAAEDTEESYGSWEDQVLQAHNVHRANHTDTGPMTWSSKLAATGQKQAAANCGAKLAHDDTVDAGSYDKGYGQNIAEFSDGEPWGSIHRMYNNELADYADDFVGDSLEANNNLYSHYTQIVWKESTEVGCGYSKCGGSQAEKLFCNYYPPGNYQGDYTNVGRPLNKAPVGLEYTRKYEQY